MARKQIDSTKERAILVVVPLALHIRLKMYAASMQSTLPESVVKALESFLPKKRRESV